MPFGPPVRVSVKVENIWHYLIDLYNVLYKLFYSYVCVFMCVHTHVAASRDQKLSNPLEMVVSSRCRCGDLKLAPLQGQQVLLTT